MAIKNILLNVSRKKSQELRCDCFHRDSDTKILIKIKLQIYLRFEVPFVMDTEDLQAQGLGVMTF